MFFFLFPYKVNRTLKQIPILTILLITANVLIYFGTSFDLLNAVKYLGFVSNIHGFYTWFTSMFLHADFFSHLLWNMYFLWLFGSMLEDALGRLKFSFIYLTSGLAACLVHAGIIALFEPSLSSTPLIGASGAIAGLLGVFVIRFYKNKISIAYFLFILFYIRWGIFEITSLLCLSLWIGRELLSGLLQLGGLASQVAHWAHIGGFLFGIAVALIFRFKNDANTEYLTEEAVSWTRMGLHGGASSRYEKLIESNPKEGSLYQELAKSMLFSENGEKEKIIENYKKAIEYYSKAQRRQETFKAYQELCNAYSDVVLDPKTQLSMASLCEGNYQYQLAVEAYRKLIDNYPDLKEAEKAMFRLAHVYLKMGSVEEADAAWEQFAERHPRSQWIPFADVHFSRNIVRS